MLLVVRDDGLQVAPESLGVILLSYMNEFMDQDVINYVQRSHHDPPANR
jgi:hypothetical protein